MSNAVDTTTSKPGTAALLAAARDLRPLLSERAAWAERERRLPDETIREMQDAGFFWHFVSQRWGGPGGSLLGQIEIGAELAKACPSTAWTFTLIGDSNGMTAAFLPAEGVEAIFGSVDAPMICGVNSFSGTATRVDGGYRIAGEWPFASGCLHSNWFYGGVLVLDEAGQVVNQGFAFAPLSEFTIKDTWHVAGMRGTGSNTVVGEGVFVPDHLMLLLTDRLAYEAEFHPEADLVARFPFAAFFSLGLTSPCLGAAEGALEYVTQNVHKRGISYYDFERQVDSAVVLERIGEAAMQIDSAWLHVRRGVHELEETTKSGTLPYETRARCRADAAHAVELLRSAVGILMDIGGASSFAESSPLQRYWRDLNVGSHHAFLNTRPLYEAYGRAYCGVSNITPYI